MTKNADAFRTISEVADALGLPQHVLRFWETRFPQIRPLKRAGGRRFYRPNDVQLLIAIKQLLYDQGYTIKGVQRVLKEQGVRAVQAGVSVEPDVAGAMFDDVPTADEETDATLEPLRASEIAPVAETSEAAEPRGTAVTGIDRDALLGTLALLEECRDILAAARR